MAFSLGKLNELFTIIPRAFGLDISDRSLKFVSLKPIRNAYEVDAFGEHEFAAGIVERGKVLSLDKLANEISAALASARDVISPHVVVALPEEEVFLRIVQLPQMSKDELAEAIKWETESNIPISIDNAYFDYQIIPPIHKPKELQHLDVLVAAAPKDTVEQYIRAVERADLHLVGIEPESVAIARSLVSARQQNDPVILMDIGAIRTRLVIHSAGCVRFTSFIPLSVQNFIKPLVASGLEAKEAERILFSIGVNKSAEHSAVFTLLVPVLTDLKEQIEKYIQFYNSHAEHEHGYSTKLSLLIVAGGGALIPGLLEYLASMLNISVEVANPWANVTDQPMREIPQISQRQAVRFSAVIGLALRGINNINE
ncbi:MAG: type IV pilus assembly protein PilM [Candidatus Spechtbacteria bacterium]|nr:type IV pilus assembly protein PilM [Candidatus Spechtbacteria bacterium]